MGAHIPDEGLDFNMALKQLQVATKAKSQLEAESFSSKQHEHVAKEEELIAAFTTGRLARYDAKVKKEIDKMTLQFQEDAAKWKEKLADKQEDQQATMHEQHDITMLREVLH